jgi:arginase
VDRLGIVWFDAHPDFHTPETSISGSLEGMALAAALGHCHDELRERIGLELSPAEENVVLAGIHNIEAGERDRLADSWLSIHPADSLGLLPVALDQLASRVDAVYLHLDVDVTTGADTPVVAQLVRLVRATMPVAAVALTNYNPDLDSGGETGAAAMQLLAALLPGEAIQ